MAVIMLINNETVKDGLQYLNDIACVFNDDHQFSRTELEKFNFLTINGTKNDVKEKIRQITPRIEHAYLLLTDNKYHWQDDGTTIGAIQVYQVEGSNKWYKLENDFKFPVNIGDLTPEEKQILETVDINHPSVDAFIRKLVKDITILSGNNVEIKELRNSEP
jgi:hypothetical protein